MKLLLMIFLFTSVKSQGFGSCDKSDAIDVSCPSPYVTKSQKISFGVKQVPGACDFEIPEFVVLVTPPEKSLSDIKWDSYNLIFKKSSSEITTIEIPPYTVVSSGEGALKIIPVRNTLHVASEVKCKLYVDMPKPSESGPSKPVEVSIGCVKNCSPKVPHTVASFPVILKAICKNCDPEIESSLKWTIKDSKGAESVDYSMLKDRTGIHFSLQADALSNNEVYEVSVEITTGTYAGKNYKVSIDTETPSEIKDCSIDPSEGKALKTLFKINCSYTKGTTLFSIYSLTDNNKANFIAETRSLEDTSFMLPAESTVYIEAVHETTGFMQNISLNVEVEKALDISATSSDAEITEAVLTKMHEAKNLAEVGNTTNALQSVASIISEYRKVSKGNVLKELDQEILKAIDNMNTDTPENAQQAADITGSICDRYDKSDPDISYKATEICHKASRALANASKRDQYSEQKRHDANSKVKSLAACSQAGMKENMESVKIIESIVTVSPTEFPLLVLDNPSEDYDDYSEDEDSADNMAKFEKSSEMMKQICFNSGKLLSTTMVAEEDPVNNREGSLSMVTSRIYCDDVLSTKVSAANVSLQPSMDCKKQKTSIVDIQMCVTEINPFWYIDNINLLSPIAFISFYGRVDVTSSMETELLGNDPFFLTFELENSAKPFLNINQSEVPKATINDLTEESFYDKISTQRIFNLKNQGFTVRFEDLSEGHYYDVTLLQFDKPSFTGFNKTRTLIDSQHAVLEVIGSRSYDSFWYLSVLPNPKMITGREGMYHFSVSTMGCYTWNSTVKQWSYACSGYPRNQFSSVTCFCNEGSTFTTYMRNLFINPENDILLNLTLKMKFCWIIFITAAVTFFVMSIILFFMSFKDRDDILEKVFFVADVPSFYNYSYILTITTGAKRNSGTTSNIMVRLIGMDGATLEHVLNYPDPDLMMVQRSSQTIFVIATKKCLGDITKMEIWFDSVGNNTKWYCENIEVFDTQLSSSWIFDVNKWFDIQKNDHHRYILQPSKETEVVVSDNKITKEQMFNIFKHTATKIEQEVNLWNLLRVDPAMSKTERLLIMYTITITIFSLVMLIYYAPTFQPTDVISKYRIGFNNKLIWTPIISSMIASALHFPLIYLIKFNKNEGFKQKRSGFKSCARRFLSFICWSIIATIGILSNTLLIIRGFWIPFETSVLWLISIILALIINIFALQNISRVIYGYMMKPMKRVELVLDNSTIIMQYIELQRIWIYKTLGALALRPYLKHLYMKLDPIALKRKFNWEDAKLKIQEILEDLIMIAIYATLLYIVLMLDRDPQALNNHDQIKELVIGKDGHSFETIHDIEMYIDRSLLPKIQANQWYGKYVQDIPGIMQDFSNKYLGIIRLRQHRTKEIKCTQLHLMQHLRTLCRPEFHELREQGSFSRGWKPFDDIASLTTERMAKVWTYSNNSISGAPTYYGEYADYPGGGYVATLGRTLRNSLINMDYLKKHKWFDHLTRAVFVEFLTYNQNANLFNSVTLAFEISASGYVVHDLKIQTRKFLVVDKGKLLTKNILSVCFLVATGMIFIRVLYKITKKKKSFFKDPWAVFDIFIVILSITSIVLFYLRLAAIQDYITQLSEAKHNAFVNYFNLFASDNTLTSLAAVLVFVATLRLWKLLRFMVIIKVMEKTMKDSAGPLLVAFVYQMVYLISFSVVGVLFFGSMTKYFRSIKDSFIHIFLFGIGLNPNFDAHLMHDHPLGVIYYLLLVFCSVFVMTIYIAIISNNYAEAKDYYGGEEGGVQKYVRDKWMYYKSLLTTRMKHLRGGDDVSDDLIIQPKGERYDDCVVIPKSRLDAMLFVTLCVLRNLENNRDYMSNEDFELISKTIKALFGPGSPDKAVFFTVGDSHHTDFIDDKNINRIANLCEKVMRNSMQLPIESSELNPLLKNRISRFNVLIENIQILKDILDNINVIYK